MNTADELVKSIFQKETLRDCSPEELQAIARQYPYFAPVQLLLAEKLKVSNDGSYHEQLKKVSLHFTNPLWLDFLLNSSKAESMNSVISENSNPDEITDQEGKAEHLNTHDTEALKSEAEIIEPLRDSDINIATGQTVTDLTRGEELKTPETISEQADTQSEIESSGEPIAIPFNQISGVPENNIDKEYIDKTEGPSGDMNRALQSETADETQQKNDESTVSIPLPDLRPEGEENQITFEPYHTVDYFASQGIKFIPDEKPVDRFGQQLKSFTEWLKAMKRLPEAEAIKAPDIQLEEKVQQLADHSVTEAEVSTEAMAEVWLKQGNKEKAIEIYNKLSLLNPSKSAYFASLVDQLKNS